MSDVRYSDKPPTCVPVLAWNGQQWVRAVWVAKRSRKFERTDDGIAFEFDDAISTAFWREGWYELLGNLNDCLHKIAVVEHVQAWKPLPPTPEFLPVEDQWIAAA